MPPIIVTGRDDRVTSSQKAHAEEKVRKLPRYFDGIVKMEVLLGYGPKEAEAEIVISVPGGKTLVCSSRGEGLHAALDLLVDKAEVQLTRYKEKLEDRRTAPPAFETPAASAAPPADEEAYQEIVERRNFR